MPFGVGAARTRVARVVFASVLALAGLALAAPAAHAQAAPTGGLQIDKIEIGGLAPAAFLVTGPVSATRTVTPTQQGVASPTLPIVALPPGTYQIQETAPIDPTDSGLSAWELTDVSCDGQFTRLNSSTVEVVVGDELVTCTFTNTLTRAEILGLKVVTGDTSTWTRPAQFHITCSGPDFELDIDIEPPVGPGGPGTYTIGQGSLPPATCTISEIDTGSDGFVQVSMTVANHGIPIASGTSSVTFTSHAGDDLLLRVTNVFALPERPEQPQPTTTTIAGGSTTTTVATTTTATNATTTTVPSGGATTTPGGDATSSTAPTSTAPTELPTTGSPTGGLLVAALVAMFGGLVLVARTRRFVD